MKKSLPKNEIYYISEPSTSSNEKSVDHVSEFVSKGRLRDFFTVLALSLHSVFEGFAVGLATDSNEVWLLFGGKIFFYFLL